MKQGYNVLSLFDGMSCGRVALDELDIPVKNYFASEIDPYAMTVASNNYLDTIQIGDITKVDGHLLPKIDLLIGGSPCQGFSFAGKQLNFEDPQSKLFFEFVRLLEECKPKFFFLENVRMKKEYQDVISKHLGVKPKPLNSKLVSGQNRERLYWTNIQGFKIPVDREILLEHILESGQNRYKSYCIDANYFKKGNLRQYFEKSRRQVIFDGCNLAGEADIKNIDMQRRVYSGKGKSPALTTMQGGNCQPKLILNETTYRHLTPLECERLQTLPDNYTIGVSNSQRYKMLGSGWTVAAVKEFFKHLPPVEDLDLY
jgi:DNA-cytosine methyltransferase